MPPIILGGLCPVHWWCCVLTLRHNELCRTFFPLNWASPNHQGPSVDQPVLSLHTHDVSELVEWCEFMNSFLYKHKVDTVKVFATVCFFCNIVKVFVMQLIAFYDKFAFIYLLIWFKYMLSRGYGDVILVLYFAYVFRVVFILDLMYKDDLATSYAIYHAKTSHMF